MTEKIKNTKNRDINILLLLVVISIGTTIYFAKSLLSRQIEISDTISGFADGLSMTISYSGMVLLILYMVKKRKMHAHHL